MSQPRSRYERALRDSTSNRATKVLSRAAIGVALVLPMACGNEDAATFASDVDEGSTTEGDAPGTTEADGSTNSDGSEQDAGPTDTQTNTQTNGEQTGGSEGVNAGAMVSSDAELLVSFSYEASTTDRAKRPYIAVWLEDSDGELVDTISLWYEQGQKGQKWLDELRQWHAATDGSDTTMSGPTRVAGEYIVSWNATDAAGNDIPQGDYVLYIEASREHGPYSLASANLSIGEESFVVSITDNEELSNLSAQLLL